MKKLPTCPMHVPMEGKQVDHEIRNQSVNYNPSSLVAVQVALLCPLLPVLYCIYCSSTFIILCIPGTYDKVPV